MLDLNLIRVFVAVMEEGTLTAAAGDVQALPLRRDRYVCMARTGRLGPAIGAQLASPDRIAIAGVGDGGLLMSLVELETAVRLKMPLMVVVYNDAAYGAEVHHFVHETDRLGTVQFPPTDIAAIAAGFGCSAVTVRQESDLSAVQDWLDGPRERPILIDAKIADFPSWVLAHSFADGE